MTGWGHKNLQRLVTFYFLIWIPVTCRYGFPGGSDSKASAYNVGDPGSIPGSGRCPGEEMARLFKQEISSDSKASAYNVGDPALIPGSRRSPGEGNGNPFQYSCLENPWMEEPGGLQPMGSQRVGHD